MKAIIMRICLSDESAIALPPQGYAILQSNRRHFLPLLYSLVPIGTKGFGQSLFQLITTGIANYQEIVFLP